MLLQTTRTPPEGKQSTHDGYIWPVERHRMVEGANITARMAEDIAARRREWPGDPVDLTILGWTTHQAVTYGWSAKRLHRNRQQARAA